MRLKLTASSRTKRSILLARLMVSASRQTKSFQCLTETMFTSDTSLLTQFQSNLGLRRKRMAKLSLHRIYQTFDGLIKTSLIIYCLAIDICLRAMEIRNFNSQASLLELRLISTLLRQASRRMRWRFCGLIASRCSSNLLQYCIRLRDKPCKSAKFTNMS